MGPFADSMGAAAFWIFIAIVAVAGIIKSVLEHQETQRTIRKSIEMGQPIDIEALSPDKPWRNNPAAVRGSEPGSLILGGLITIAGGVGLAILALFIGIEEGQPVYPLIGIGLIAVLVGGVLFGFGRWALAQQRKDDLGR